MRGGFSTAAGGAGGEAAPAPPQRDRLLAASRRLEHSSARLQQGRRQLAEAEAAGQSALAELARQRETLERAQRTLDGTDGDLRQADSLLKAMARRAKWFFG